MANAPQAPPDLIRWPLEALAGIGRQVGREWRAGAVHRLTIAGPRPRGLAAQPRDPRPPDLARGVQAMAGVFSFGGEALRVGAGSDPWRLPTPSRRFAAALHGFVWAPDLIATGETGRREALRLWLAWRRVFGAFNAFAWSGAALERRVFNLACAAPALLPLASEAEAASFVADLARQARHLLSDGEDPGREAERATVSALVGAALDGKAGEQLLARALSRLSKAAPEAVLRDGVHASRAPERGLELLFDLLALDDALSQLGAPAPLEVARSIDRLGAAARFFAQPSGRLAVFHGGEPGSGARLAAALALETAATDPGKSLPYGRFHRLQAPGLGLIVDAGPSPGRPWSRTGCAQPGAIDVVGDGRRIVVGSAWSTRGDADAGLRGPAGGSCLALDGRPPDPIEVSADRHEDAGAVWLDVVHDGWRRSLGVACARRLYLDIRSGELRGEETLTPAGRRRDGSADFAVRFHLAPGAAASLALDGKSALIRPDGGPGWRLRSDAAMRLEPGVVFEDGEAKAGQVLLLAGLVRLSAGGRMRWKLSRGDS